MSAIIKLLDSEIAKYESLIKNLKASRDAIAAAEAMPKASGATKRRGRPPKSGAKTAKTASTGRKRGRPRKNVSAGTASAGSATAAA